MVLPVSQRICAIHFPVCSRSDSALLRIFKLHRFLREVNVFKASQPPLNKVYHVLINSLEIAFSSLCSAILFAKYIVYFWCFFSFWHILVQNSSPGLWDGHIRRSQSHHLTLWLVQLHLRSSSPGKIYVRALGTASVPGLAFITLRAINRTKKYQQDEVDSEWIKFSTSQQRTTPWNNTTLVE